MQKPSNKLSIYSDNNWMLLLIDADKNPDTGWFGYDFIVNKNIKNGNTTTLMKFDPDKSGNHWREIADLNYRFTGNKLELAIPRAIAWPIIELIHIRF